MGTPARYQLARRRVGGLEERVPLCSPPLLERLKISDIRFFINAYNLISFDDMSQYNISAEIPNAGVTLYPETRVINVGTSLRF